MRRHALGHSSKMFSKHAGASHTHPMNTRTPGPLDRGGIRL
nr:MAG: hypothetical protein [Microviridae sp.]